MRRSTEMDETTKRPQEPLHDPVINDFNTKNLDKAAYLMTKGARYKDCSIPDKDSPIGFVILDNVARHHVREFWNQDVEFEFWPWKRNRKFLKDKIAENHLQIVENGK